ncbi:hypothetical protein FA95DRAFT_1562282 [Auriscalpium vulgare]|uniref:Uncharacterized protein n=1 Tax=Auriscalpium vulgare TaxID=40419 RepID=A0ACB8RKL8_9AGAM|nr:hypothetical protein FA95DRAFT_1562282 [Auriscalpium vulgare]
MSFLPKTRLPMRIVALPLTNAVRSARHPHDIPAPLVYYHFQTPPRPAKSRQGWVDWATDKAVASWADFGKAPETSWKFKVFQYGERIVDRIDFEELALKGVDPSLGPRISHPKGPTEDEVKHALIPLVHPTFMGSSALSYLERILAKRTPRHRKGFLTWMLLAPLTAPFMLIPIIPNLPFFFCVWRSWSHFKAFKASEYLESLLQRGAIVAETNAGLDEIYMAHAPALSAEAEMSRAEALRLETERVAEKEGKVLLTRDAVPPVLSLFELPSSSASDMYRAIAQAKMRVKE